MGTHIRTCLIPIIIGAVLGYRLPETVVPSEYRLEIITNLGDEGNQFDFNGTVWIDISSISPTTNITLHSKNLNIHNEDIKIRPLHIKQDNNLKAKAVQLVTEDDFLVIHLSEPLKKGHKYQVEIPFHGILEEGLAGYYRSYYTDNKTGKRVWLSVTHFEPSDARRAFPCFDEPAMKAKFTISLGRHKKYSSISNMPIMKTEDIPNKPEWEWDRFETSVPMSTYLVAFAVTDFSYEVSPKYENNVTFRTWCRRDALDQIHLAKDVGPKFLRFFEKYFHIDYPLPKQDMIAVPDFASGAMENWGLITFRESSLLFDEKQSSALNKLSVAHVIAHELAHQWFGNLVTMKWWTNLWLNEGFATYMSSIAVANIFPQWKQLESITVDNILSVFGFDSLKTSHPVSVPIGHPKEISEIFDTISYEKGSYLLHMMTNFLGEEVLRQGVSNYLKRHEYSNAEKNDLWRSLTEEAHDKKALPKNLTVETVMDSWALQTGYPLITVKRFYGKGYLEVRQERFFKDRNMLHSAPTKWWIPLSYTTESEQNFTTKPKLWFAPSTPVEVINDISKDSDWVIFNIKASGLYRVNYDERNWNLLIDALKSKKYKEIPALNRMLLLDSSANLAWIGRLDYCIFFDMIEYLEQERDILPWKSALQTIGNLDTLLKRTSVYGEFKEYIKKILKPIFNRIGGFQNPEKADENMDMIEHKVQITGAACRYQVEHCETEAIELFRNIQKNSTKESDIPNDLRDVVYCNAAKYGGQEEWNTLWNMYLKSNVASVKLTILMALGCTQHIWLLQRYLEMTLDSNSLIRKQDMQYVFDSVTSNDIGFHVSRNFIQDNIKEIYKRYNTSVGILSNIIGNLATNTISTSEHEWLKNFTNSNAQYFKDIKNSVKQALEKSLLKVQWHEKKFKEVKNRLQEYKVGESVEKKVA